MRTTLALSAVFFLASCAAASPYGGGDRDSGVEGDADADEGGQPDAAMDADEDDEVLSFVGGPVTLDDETLAGGRPEVVWNGEGWGVAWTEHIGMAARVLDEVATPLGPPITLPSVHMEALAWHDGRYAVAGNGRSGEALEVAILDAGFGLLDTLMIDLGDAEHPHVTWSEDADGWIVGYVGGVGDDSTIDASVLDAAGGFRFGGLVIGGAWEGGPRIVTPRGRIAVLWPSASGVLSRIFALTELDSAPPSSLALPASLTPTTGFEAESFDDLVVIVATARPDVLVGVVDASAAELLPGPVAIGPTSITDSRPGIAAAPERGYLGVCYVTGSDPMAGAEPYTYGVALQLVAPDGSPLGARLSVASDLERICGCNLAWNGEELLVAYWMCAGDAEQNTVLAQRVRPRD